jgi:hypothetical protein
MSTQTETVRGNNTIDYKRFDELEMKFSNKSKLTLKYVKSTKFYGFLPGDLLELTYGEHHYGEMGDVNQETDESKHYYVGSQTQFFPVNALKEAIAAFFERMNSNEPWKESRIFPSYRLEQCLTEDPNKLTLLDVK